MANELEKQINELKNQMDIIEIDYQRNVSTLWEQGIGDEVEKELIGEEFVPVQVPELITLD